MYEADNLLIAHGIFLSMQLMSCVELFGVLDKLTVLEILKGSWAVNQEN